ncbi:eCIS core domain-containing protein [Methanosarcina sp.]|uniref:eCIS core domain-containing protein n=1 Tax=Methanosarcina sp. TaxID=2213 RepID=UPI003C757466
MAEKAKVRAIKQEPKQKCSNSCKQDTSYSSSGAPASRILQLQRTAGNQAVQRLIKSKALQAKLTIGQPGDIYEQEADQVAEQVMRMPTSPSAAMGQATIQRQTLKRDEVTQIKPLASTITPLVQRAPSNSMKSFEPGTNFESKLNISSGGIPLPASTRAFMEPRFGADFNGVRLHMDSQAEQLNRSISAQAFTLGQDIFLGGSWNDLESNTGKKLLAHELTHTIQQSSGQVTGLQRTIGEGHDLKSSRFAGDPILEACYDDKARLTRGSQGRSVAKIQQALMDLGYDLGPKGADGNYGLMTWNAVKQFKTDQHLGWEHVGDVGPGTMGRLDELFPSGLDIPEEEDEAADGDTEVLGLAEVPEEVSDTPEILDTLTETVPLGIQMFKIQMKETSKKKPKTSKKKSAASAEKTITLIEVDQEKQRMKITFSDGNSVSRAVSTGRGLPNTKDDPCKTQTEKNCTPNGTFKITSKGDAKTENSEGDAMAWYVGFVDTRGIGIHDSQPVPGVPHSHGCVRVGDSPEAMKFAEMINKRSVLNKTMVIVRGKAPTHPWKKKLAKKKP